jgi:hypothetical protein
MKQFCFPLSVLYNDYSAFNPTIAHLTTKGWQSLYNKPPTRFGLNMAILSKVSYKEIQQLLIRLKTWICWVKIRCFLLKLLKMFNIRTNYKCLSYTYILHFMDICPSLLTNIKIISLSFLGIYPCVVSRCLPINFAW